MKRTLNLEISAPARYRAALSATVRKAHAVLKPPLRELSLAVVDAREMARLHRRFLGKSGATDVLTFELNHARSGEVISGEVIICSTVAARQARLRGHETVRELQLYALHGLLHLCAFDDRTAAAYRIMHDREDQILTRLGIGKTFAAPLKGRVRHRGGRRCRSS